MITPLIPLKRREYLSGGNGSGKMYFQRGNYLGEEKRAQPRIELTDQAQGIVEELKGFMGRKCPDSCRIPKEMRPHLGHGVGVISEMGDESIETGLNRFSDYMKFVKNFINTIKKSRSTFWDTLLKGVGGLILLLLALGIMELIKIELQGG